MEEDMTREEAIRLLVRIKDRINFEVTDAQKKWMRSILL